MNIDAFSIVHFDIPTRGTSGQIPYFALGSTASSMEMNFTPSLVSPTVRILVDLNMRGWRLVRPVKLTIEIDDDGTHIASDDEFSQYGEGASIDRAINDYVSSLLEYYEVLETQAKDHKPTAGLLRRLQSVLTKTGIARRAV